MKKNVNKIISSVLTGIFLCFTFVSPVFAVTVPALKISLNEENGYSVSLYITNPEKVTSVDFAMTILNVGAFTFSDLQIKTEGAVDINGEFSEKDKFIYHFEKDDAKLSFSGFFSDGTGTKEDIHLCDITFTEGQSESESTSLQFTYSLSSDKYTIPGSIRFSLQNGEYTEENAPIAYYSGDIDFDGKVTASDARTILRSSVGLDDIKIAAFPYADTDFNGVITAADARTVLRTSVGLEEEILHSFSVQMKNSATCDEGGEYFFFCTLTNTEYCVKGESFEHDFRDKDCTHNKECKICGETVEYTDGHDFTEEGICSVCGQSESNFYYLKDLVISLLNNVSEYDSAAANAAAANDYKTYIMNASDAVKQLRICLNSIENTVGAYEIHQELKKAYNIRFSAFLRCTNDSGNIPVTENSFNIIKEAVSVSMYNINYARSLFATKDTTVTENQEEYQNG